MAKSHTYKIDLNLNSSSLQKELKETGKDLDSLQESFKRFSDYGVDASKAYRGVLKDLVREQDKELKFYDEEAAKIINNSKLTKKQKDEQLKILEKEKKLSEAKKKELQLQDKYNKLTGRILNTQTKSGKLIAQGLKAQEKLNALLGKESKLRQGMAKAAKAGAKIAGVAAVGAGVVGGAIAATSAVAQQQVTKADALRLLAPGVNPSLVGELYTKTGADYSTIVNAINNIAAIVGTSSDRLAKLASTEIRNPGTGALMAAQNKIKEDTDYEQVFNAIRKQTGVNDTQALVQASMQSRAVSTGKVSQQDYMLALAKLTGSGVDAETANRIISSIAKSGKKEDFIERFNKADLSRYVRGQMKNVLKNTDLTLTSIAKTDTSESPEAIKAREFAEKMRRMEELKNQFLVKLFDAFEPHMDEIVNGLNSFLSYASEKLPTVLNKISEYLETLADSRFVRDLNKLSEISQMDTGDAIKELFKSSLVGQALFGERAQGGLVTAPSLCGEAGPELVLPLSNPGRCNSIINNFNNTNNFSMNAPQSPLSLSQAISQNRFIKHASVF